MNGFIEKNGRKRSLISGSLILVIAIAALGLTALIRDDQLFFYAALASRIVQGLAEAMILTPLFASAVSDFPVNRAFYCGLIEGSMGFGRMVGPLYGQQIYNSFGY